MAGPKVAPPAPPGVPAPPPPAKNGTLVRLIVSPLVLGLVVAVCWIHASGGPALGTDLLLVLFAAVGGFEMARLVARPDSKPVELWLPTLACAALGAVGLFAPEGGVTRGAWRAGLTAGGLVALLFVHWRDVRPDALDRIARAFVPVAYVGLLFSWLRDVADGPDGGKRLIWVVLISKASDMGGWLVGKPFGRHKLVPSVSPGKSWEGLAGGLAASILVAVLVASPLGLPQASWGVLPLALFGLALGLASVAAGITQSGWKRRAGVKDSAPLIPEMGGVLDMIDSLLFAAPVAVLWFWFAP